MTSTPHPRAKCRGCGCNATKTHPLTNGHCSNACAVSTILNRSAR